MKIYVAHSRNFDYKNELYKPIRDNIKEHEIILPHENDTYEKYSRDFYKGIDLVVAECSYPATGLGIELGFFFDDNKPIYCIYKKGNKISHSISAVTNNIFEYDNTEDMIKTIKNIIEGE